MSHGHRPLPRLMEAAPRASRSSRYLEEVDTDGVLGSDLAQVWCGSEDLNDEGGVQAVQTETLDLQPDGSFRHSLALMVEAASSNDVSSCSGRWRLYKVRHLGADVDAPTDRELGFTRADGSRPLLAERLLVCGVNPILNGFGGAACRLRPRDMRRPGAPRGAVPLEAEEEADIRAARQRGQKTRQLEAEVEPEPSAAEVCQLAEVTGRSQDECFAALLEHGSLDAAALHLLAASADAAPLPEGAEGAREAGDAAGIERGRGSAMGSYGEERAESGRPGVGAGGNRLTVGSTMAEVMALEKPSAASRQQAEQLSQVTGRHWEECLATLEAHDGCLDDAAAALLGLPAQEEGTTDAPTSRHGGAQVEGSDAQMECASESAHGLTEVLGTPTEADIRAARQLAEVTGMALATCLEALQASGGQTDVAAARLLDLEEESAENDGADGDAQSHLRTVDPPLLDFHDRTMADVGELAHFQEPLSASIRAALEKAHEDGNLATFLSQAEAKTRSFSGKATGFAAHRGGFFDLEDEPSPEARRRPRSEPDGPEAQMASEEVEEEVGAELLDGKEPPRKIPRRGGSEGEEGCVEMPAES